MKFSPTMREAFLERAAIMEFDGDAMGMRHTVTLTGK